MQDTSHHEHIATRSERLVAVILEIIVFLLIGFFFGWLGNFIFGQWWIMGIEPFGESLGGAAVIGVAIVQIVLMVRLSQTIGKYMLDLQVVRHSTEKRVGFWRYWFREIIGKTLVIGLVPIIGIVFQPIYFVIDTLFIFRKDKRTLHDFIAGTKVIHLPVEKRAKSFFDFSKL